MNQDEIGSEESKRRFQHTFTSGTVPYVDGKVTQASDILITVTYKRKIVRKIVTTVRVMRKKVNNKIYNNNKDREELRSDTTSRLEQTSTIDKSTLRVKPVGVIKWNVEFKTPADWCFGLHHSQNSLTIGNQQNQHNSFFMTSSSTFSPSATNVPKMILPIPAIISTKSELINAKLFSTNRCQSPSQLENAIEAERKIKPKQHQQQGNRSNNQNSHQGNADDDDAVVAASGERKSGKGPYHINSFGSGALELVGDADSVVPPKIAPERLMVLMHPRFVAEFAAFRRVFRLIPDCKMLVIDNLCRLMVRAAGIKMVDKDFSTTSASNEAPTITTNATTTTATTAKKNANSSMKNKQQQPAQAEILHVTFDNVKIVARMATYCFAGGPFRLYRIRYGYDPRREPREKHFNDQVIMFKTRDAMVRSMKSNTSLSVSMASALKSPRIVLRDCRAAADRIFGHNNAQTGLRNVLLKIRNDYLQQQQQFQQDKNNEPTMMMMMMAPLRRDQADENFLPQHDLFSRLLLSNKVIFFLCVGDFISVPKFAKTLNDGKSDTFDHTRGWITTKGWRLFFDLVNDSLYDWIVDVVSPNLSKDTKVVDFFSIKMPTLNTEQKRKMMTAKTSTSKNSNKNDDDDGDEDGDDEDIDQLKTEDDVFGNYYSAAGDFTKLKKSNHYDEDGHDNNDFSFDEFDVNLGDEERDDENNDTTMMMMSGNRRQREITTTTATKTKNSGNQKLAPTISKKKPPRSSASDEMMQVFGFEDDDFDRDGGYRENSEEFQL